MRTAKAGAKGTKSTFKAVLQSAVVKEYISAERPASYGAAFCCVRRSLAA
jgi:hypothetical protein